MKPYNVHFYMPRLSAADLLALMEWGGTLLSSRAEHDRTGLVPFAGWLRGVAVAELERRQGDDLIESTLPRLPLDELSMAELSSANMYLFCLSRETESQAIGEFADAILDVVVSAILAHSEDKERA